MKASVFWYKALCILVHSYHSFGINFRVFLQGIRTFYKTFMLFSLSELSSHTEIRKTGAVTLLPLYVFIAWTGMTSHFPLFNLWTVSKLVQMRFCFKVAVHWNLVRYTKHNLSSYSLNIPRIEPLFFLKFRKPCLIDYTSGTCVERKAWRAACRR
jgi:hypothetical protein